MEYTIAQIEKIRGFHALTQKEERLINKLLENVNTLNGKKSMGFNKTRKEVLMEEFDREALEEMVLMSLQLTEMLGNRDADQFIKGVQKQLLERIIRDHVPLGMCREFRLSLAQRVELNGGDVEKTMDQLKGYFTCGKIVSVAETFRHVCHELKERKVIYLVPTAI